MVAWSFFFVFVLWCVIPGCASFAFFVWVTLLFVPCVWFGWRSHSDPLFDWLFGTDWINPGVFPTG